jgi:hypothetical protein
VTLGQLADAAWLRCNARRRSWMTRSRCLRPPTSVQSRHSVRTVRTHRSAEALARGVRNGVQIMSTPSLRNTSSNGPEFLESRSRTKARTLSRRPWIDQRLAAGNSLRASDLPAGWRQVPPLPSGSFNAAVRFCDGAPAPSLTAQRAVEFDRSSDEAASVVGVYPTADAQVADFRTGQNVIDCIEKALVDAYVVQQAKVLSVSQRIVRLSSSEELQATFAFTFLLSYRGQPTLTAYDDYVLLGKNRVQTGLGLFSTGREFPAGLERRLVAAIASRMDSVP